MHFIERVFMESTYEYAKIKFKLFFSARLKDEPCEEIFEEFVQNYGSEETKIAIGIACNYYSDFLTAFQKIGGILYRRKIDCENISKRKNVDKIGIFKRLS